MLKRADIPQAIVIVIWYFFVIVPFIVLVQKIIVIVIVPLIVLLFCWSISVGWVPLPLPAALCQILINSPCKLWHLVPNYQYQFFVLSSFLFREYRLHSRLVLVHCRVVLPVRPYQAMVCSSCGVIWQQSLVLISCTYHVFYLWVNDIHTCRLSTLLYLNNKCIEDYPTSLLLLFIDQFHLVT